ncbi:hypothetical protein EJ04DRAFT_573371 [Polyplosphaeria fusca]|uniref:Uncharacterized protein n=1 Tax=Polyplosphaeria fusca TaxID=682080 RepID=A0A9P4V6W9_9PLEO|nr:hypothetical protein EJ04DRAFT_573371 [Polyplosphaeria fusca]
MLPVQIIATVFLAAAVSAGSVLPRQIAGGAACNIARLQIVSALRQTGNSVADIQDQTVAQEAQAGLDQASDGISQIAQAIIAGEAPPQDGRDLTEAGLAATTQALAGGDTSDPAVVAAQQSIQQAAEAGADVVAEC